MCRLSAFATGTSRKEALAILDRLEWIRNKDGFGYSYIENGKIITKKWALSFSELIKRKYPLLEHIEKHNGWTICHLRAASVGSVTKENSHPFNIDNKWSICHNGTVKNYGLMELCLSKFIKLGGWTDSEICSNLINIISPRTFALSDEIENCGVFLCLNVDGTLEVIKNSGDLVFHETEDKKVLLASELSHLDYKQCNALRGWYKFNADGTFNKFVERKWSSSASYTGYTGNPWRGDFHNVKSHSFQSPYVGYED